MIFIYTGRPGSGKSYNMAKKIKDALRRGKNVISTVPIDINYVSKGGRKKIGNYLHIPINEITPDQLYAFMINHHEKGIESQTLVFIDECQIIFNARHWNQGGRMDWVIFFTTHRHLGFDIYLITQSDSFVDKQMRPLIEIEIKHRKVSSYLWWLPITVFVQREEWYGHSQKVKISSGFVLCVPTVFKIYDSYTIYDEIYEKYKHLEIREDEAEVV
ncbi:MAG: zonular occludens toxin domain-containing protein [Defluviitaleaceae bacterium]|nr:zonular occludens toxin domain-containing protein [Defluviitaleaceae bacterium]